MKRVCSEFKTYRVLQTCILNGVKREVNSTITFTTIFRGTNSKNINYIPKDLLDMLIKNEVIKSLILCED